MTTAPAIYLQPLPVLSQPWQSVSMDLITHLPRSAADFDSIVTFVDWFSKMVHFVPCTTKLSAPGLATIFLHTIVCKYGMPKNIVSDRDSCFTIHFWKSFVDLLQCKHFLSSSYHIEMDE